MHVHSLVLDDFYNEEYFLIGIHTALEDYQLAYLLNKQLKINFKRDSFHLDFENEKKNDSFSIFKYIHTAYDFDWSLISNSTKDTEKNASSDRLLLFTETKKYLIPEKKNIDYFIKISGDVPFEFVSETIQRIKEIPQIITSYQIDTDTLKSKDFLIF
ncbi:MAG: IPExxxVDY family protein [Polaribacter sp.]